MVRRAPSFVVCIAAALAVGCAGSGDVVDAGLDDGRVENGRCAPHGERFDDRFECAGVDGPTATEHDGPANHGVTGGAALDDVDYDWVVEEIVACSCVCCHHNEGSGAYRWSVDYQPAWTDSADRSSLLSLAGLDGAAHLTEVIAPVDNQGFSRLETGLPTTDAPRLRAFVERELARRATVDAGPL